MSNLERYHRIALATSLVMSMVACTAGDQVVGSRPVEISAPVVTTRSNVEGLQQDIADLRSLSRNDGTGISMGENAPRAEFVAGLEAQLKAFSKNSPSPIVADASATPSPDGRRFDYLSPSDVGGQTSALPAGADSHFRYETTYAYTSCSHWSGVVGVVEPSGTLNDFATNGPIGSLAFLRTTGVNYASMSQRQGIQYNGLVAVHVNTKHTCQIYDSTGQFPYKTTESFTVI